MRALLCHVRARRRRRIRLSGRRGWGRRRRVAGRQRNSLRAAIGASIHRLGRHEEQMSVYRDIPCPPGHIREAREFGLTWVVDVVKGDAVVVTYKEMVATKRQVRVRRAGIEGRPSSPAASATCGSARWRRRSRGRRRGRPRGEARRFRQIPNVLHPEGGFGRIVKARL